MEKHTDFEVVFWGVRGSFPAQAKNTEYGINTCCIEVQAGKTRMIFDAGSGIIPLGRTLALNKQTEAIHIFLSHYHWDHINGIIHFPPMYLNRSDITVYGGQYEAKSCRELIKSLFMSPYHPVEFKKIPSILRFCTVTAGDNIPMGEELTVEAIALEHPDSSLGYKINYQDHSICYITDVELGMMKELQELQAFIAGTDLLIIDAMYCLSELDHHFSKRGWGHSAWEEAVQLAAESGVKRLVLYHLNPEREDEELEQILKQARALFPDTVTAMEGMRISVL